MKTQNIFLKETSSNLEYQVINNEKELLNLLENQNYQNETCDCIEDYEIKLKDKTYFIYDLQESIHIRLDEKEAKLSKEDSDKLSNIIEETITN